MTRTLVLGAVLACSGLAHAAETNDPALAEALFEEGKTLLEKGEYAAACPKFAESYRLDPATGAVFALALCHERQGRLATAWVEYLEAASRANADHSTEREASARQRAAALEPRLSHLIVRVDAATAGITGLTVFYDGTTLRPAAFGTWLPVDPGKHVARAEAPGYRAAEATVQIGDKPEWVTLTIPRLEPIPGGVPATGHGEGKASQKNTHGLEFTPLRVGGIALGAAGVASLGIGLAATIVALDKKSSSDATCGANGCDPPGHDDRVAAREAATWATVGAVSGAVLLSAGAVLFVLGKPAAKSTALGTSTLLVGGNFAAFRHEF
jgi:hypothetical protein